MSRGSQSIFRKANLAIRRAKEANLMANVEKYDDLTIGSGIAGKFTAWTRDSRRRTVIVERGLLGGACPNVACLPSKNLIWSAIWAMGDCAGSPQFTHVGLDDYGIVHANLSGGDRTNRNRLIPFCMFTDPELARVGKNEVEAHRDGIEYRLPQP